MRKTYIFVILILAAALYFVLPQNYGDMHSAAAEAVQVSLASKTAKAATEASISVPVQEKPEVEEQPDGRNTVLKQPAAPPQAPQEEPIAEEEARYREGLAAYIVSVNQTVTEDDALDMVDCMLEQAAQYHMDEKLIMAIAHTESTYYSDAVSSADFKGLMQTGDVLAEEAGYSPEALFDPEVSIAVGAEYISDQLEHFNQDVSLALTAYNQGPGAVEVGNYGTSYADLTLRRVENIETFLLEEGYL